MTTGEISVKIGAGENDLLHFKFCTRAEFMAGEIKRGMGYEPYAQVDFGTSVALQLVSAIKCHPANKIGVEHDFMAVLDLLDQISDADREKVLEVANKSMGFIMAALQVTTKNLAALQEKHGQNGSVDGTKDSALPLAG